MKTKRISAVILSFILILSSLSVTSYAGIYETYDDITGTLVRTSDTALYPGDALEVILKVDFDTNSLDKIVAFDLIGSYTNLTLTGIEFLGDSASADIPNPDDIDLIANLGDGSPELSEPVKTNKSTIIDKSKNGVISYTVALLRDSTYITEDPEEGLAKLVKFKFTTVYPGAASLTLNDCYLRKDYTYTDDHRELKVAAFSTTVNSIGGGGGGGSGSGSGGGISVTPGIIVPPVEPTPDQPGTGSKRKYADMSDSDWHYEKIDKLYEQGYINGTGEEDGAIVISPNSNITRQEAAKLSVDALRLNVLNGVPGFSDDHAAAEWAIPYIYTAAAHSKRLIKGYPEDNSYRPLKNITRAEFAVIIMNTFDFVMLEEYDMSMFRDSDDITWAAPYIATLVKHDIVKGYEDQCFYPDKFITRAEAFIMMYRALDAFGMIK